jgi:hypothetical protein
MKKKEVAVMTEQQNTSVPHSGIDPGYLMVLVYVLGITALVLFGWFGAAGAHSGSDAGTAETVVIIRSLGEAPQP